ncbi:MAG: hypothetical protein ACLQIQ_00070 [Beijerinckiaceae bacterium]
MHSLVHGLRERAATRPRTLIASHGKVWLWPGIALTSRRGDQIVASSGETIRFWITRLHGPDALYTEAVHCIERAAEHLTRGDENTAQCALDAIGLNRLSSDGAALMWSVAKKLDLEWFDMPVRPGPRCLTARDIAMQVPFFEEVFDRAAPLAKFGPFDPLKHPRWPAGAPDSQGGEFADADESGAAIIPVGTRGRRRNSPRRPPPDLDQPPAPAGHNSENLKDAPKIPKEEPPPEERYTAVKEIGQEMEEALVAGAGAWVPFFLQQLATIDWLMRAPTYYYYQLKANLDPPKTLEELQDAVDNRTLGYHTHHIVEWQAGLDEGFPKDKIESRENLVQVPEMKHRALTDWYATPNPKYYNGSSGFCVGYFRVFS